MRPHVLTFVYEVIAHGAHPFETVIEATNRVKAKHMARIEYDARYGHGAHAEAKFHAHLKGCAS